MQLHVSLHSIVTINCNVIRADTTEIKMDTGSILSLTQYSQVGLQLLQFTYSNGVQTSSENNVSLNQL